MDIKTTIESVLKEAFSKENEGKTLKSINDDDILLDIGIDSLSYAVVILKLEQLFGYDPFIISEEPFYPQTFGQLVDFYIKNKP